MGQNTLKSAVFSLLDFSILQPFGDTNVQFWKTKSRLIQGEKAVMINMSSSIDIFSSRDWFILSFFFLRKKLDVLLGGFFHFRDVQEGNIFSTSAREFH